MLEVEISDLFSRQTYCRRCVLRCAQLFKTLRARVDGFAAHDFSPLLVSKTNVINNSALASYVVFA